MTIGQGCAAAWAAPLLAQLNSAAPGSAKRTHKLAPMPCVLWLPDFGAYVGRVDLLRASFTTCAHAENALRLSEDQAQAVGQDLIDATGVRLHLRPFYPQH